MQSDAIPSRPVTLLRSLVLLTFGDLLDGNLLTGLEILGRAAGSHSDTQSVSEPTLAVAVVPAAAAADPLVLCVCNSPHDSIRSRSDGLDEFVLSVNIESRAADEERGVPALRIDRGR
jgi:hypothetical protein